MAIRFYLSLRRSLMAGSMAAALVAMALVFAVIATFSQMCAAAELDDSSAATAGYRVFNDDALTQWDWKLREWWGEHLSVPYAAGDLAEAMRQNPHLRVMSVNGYFDLATPFYATGYALAHLGVDAPLRANVRIAYYPTGHMIYLDDAALHALKRDLASFYKARAG